MASEQEKSFGQEKLRNGGGHGPHLLPVVATDVNEDGTPISEKAQVKRQKATLAEAFKHTREKSRDVASSDEEDEGSDKDDNDTNEIEESTAINQDNDEDDDDDEDESGSGSNSDEDMDGKRESKEENFGRGASGESERKKKKTIVISATPTRKITKKPIKAVKRKSSKGSVAGSASRQSEEDKLEAAKPIVSRFLDLGNSKLNEKLVQVFMIDGIMEFLVQHITRVDASLKPPPSQKSTNDHLSKEAQFLVHAELCHRKRDYSDMDLIKKSYTTMTLLTRHNLHSEFLLCESVDSVLNQLFEIFDPASNGNFYHFQKVMETIVKLKWDVAMHFLMSDRVGTGKNTATREPHILKMLPYLDYPPVAASLAAILLPPLTRSGRDLMSDCYHTLNDHHFLEKLLALVTVSEVPSPGYGDFLIALLDEAPMRKEMTILLGCLTEQSIWVERLVEGAQSANAIRKKSCIEVLYSVLVRSIQTPYQDVFANNIYMTAGSFDRVESHLEAIANGVAELLQPHIPTLCSIFADSHDSGGVVQLPGYRIESSLTVSRLWLLDSIYHCLGNAKESPTILEAIPERFWTCLVNTFFQYPFNSAFHVQFYKLFRVALWSESPVVYERFFVNTDIVVRMIEHYNRTDNPTGSRGYIILILNCIRLSADVEVEPPKEDSARDDKDSSSNNANVSKVTLQADGDVEMAEQPKLPAHFWTDRLTLNQPWQGFMDELRTATVQQTCGTSYDMDPNLRYQFAPIQARQPSESPLTKRHTGIPGITATGRDGIDLGSQYANSLGFGVPMVYKADEQDEANLIHEKAVQEALASLMPNMNWKLIPPKRLNSIHNKLKDSMAANGITTLEISDSKPKPLPPLRSEGATSLGGNGTGTNSKDISVIPTAEPDTTTAESKALTEGAGTGPKKAKKKNKKKRARDTKTEAEGGVQEDSEMELDPSSQDHHHQAAGANTGMDTLVDGVESSALSSGIHDHEEGDANSKVVSDQATMDKERRLKEKRREKRIRNKNKKKLAVRSD